MNRALAVSIVTFVALGACAADPVPPSSGDPGSSSANVDGGTPIEDGDGGLGSTSEIPSSSDAAAPDEDGGAPADAAPPSAETSPEAGSDAGEPVVIAPSDGLLGHWRGSGNDDGPFAKHADLHGVVPATDRFGGMNAGHFEGGAWMEIANLPLLPQGSAPWTLSVWLRTTGTALVAPYPIVAGWGNPSVANAGAEIGIRSRTPGIYDGSRVRPARYHVTDGTWHHVVLRYDGTNVTTAVDGLLQTSTLALELAGSTIVIGKATAAGAEIAGFEGDVDDVRIWNRALDEAEIQSFTTEGGYLDVHCMLEEAPPITGPRSCGDISFPPIYTYENQVRSLIRPSKPTIMEVYSERLRRAANTAGAVNTVIVATDGATQIFALESPPRDASRVARRTGDRTVFNLQASHTGACRLWTGTCWGIGTTDVHN